MSHSIALISTIAIGLGCALVLGFIAVRLKLPALVGYLIAGVLIGPATPGFVADIELSRQLAEIGVMLLMFGVGLHFSLDDLLSVRRIALPGAIVQIVVATALGVAVATHWGWSLGGAIVFGLSLSVASTVVIERMADDAPAPRRPGSEFDRIAHRSHESSECELMDNADHPRGRSPRS
jgi:CPA2 family monovalent cation:H+ antiporter-2